MPTVSVIVPTYNRADALPRTIESVLSQTHEDLELFVVDDASTDDTRAVVAAYEDDRLTYLRHEQNRGGSAARNTGIDASTGEYVAFLDSDDEWRAGKLERQLAELEGRDDDWVAAYCGVTMVRENRENRVLGALRRRFGRLHDTEGAEGGAELVGAVLADDLHTSAGSTLLVERAVAEQIDGFDESFDRFQDPEFLLRVLREGKLAFVDAPLVRRYASGSPSADALREADEHYLETFAETVDQLEAAGRDIRGAHAYFLAKAYLAEGRFGTGLRYLVRARRPSPRQYPGLAASVLSGVAAATRE
mgnify:CR=1 FL=1